MRASRFALAVLGSFSVLSAHAHAQVCDVDGCGNALAAAAGVLVNDVFHDASTRTAQQAPVYGFPIDPWPGCPEHVSFAGAGMSSAPYDCPATTSTATTPTVANARTFLGAVDHRFWEPCRLASPTVDGSGCIADWTCIAQATPGNYLPWTGLVLDLGAASNQVVVFGENLAAGPQPCRSLDVTVFFTDNPFAHAATDVVLDPATDGIDPMRWNRATLSRVYASGWVSTRVPDPVGHAGCGDTATYAVESDSFAKVYALPCGVSLRYVAIVPGNDGRDEPSCAFDRASTAIDAVAGMVDGAFVCPDADHDGAMDCSCPGAPTVCDCNDADPNVHPGAPEACDSAIDLDCDGTAGGGSCTDPCAGVVCPGTETCHDGACIEACATVRCAGGRTCVDGDCVIPCSCYASNAGCASGSACDRNAQACVAAACVGMSCNGGETCVAASGTCEPFCGPSVVCPAGQACVGTLGCVASDAGVDAGPNDAGSNDAATSDAGHVDAAHVDAGADAATPRIDAASAMDGGTVPPASSSGCGCRTDTRRTSSGAIGSLLILGLVLARRRLR